MNTRCKNSRRINRFLNDNVFIDTLEQKDRNSNISFELLKLTNKKWIN